MTSDRPRISVLLPVRDARATLGAALRSVARQREGRFECVVADDGSRDGSLAVARDFAARDPRFRVLELPRRGLVEALTAGLAACGAPLVARMDADDVMHRDRLAAAVAQAALLDLGVELREHVARGQAHGLLGLRTGQDLEEFAADGHGLFLYRSMLEE